MRTAREAFGLKSWWFGKCSKTTFRCTRACPDPRRSGLSRGAPRHCQAPPAQRSRWPGRVSAGRPGPGSAVPHDPENFTLLLREPPAMEDFPRNGGFPLKRWWRGGRIAPGGCSSDGVAGGRETERRFPARRCPPAGAGLRSASRPAPAQPVRWAAGTTPHAAPWRDRGTPWPPRRHHLVPSHPAGGMAAGLG